mmetsp:Transcript_25739/g.25556  ORF Transcript_25739/g.25556 Transcript_25739/m.25556 type:complete len:174 (+) Transcript_25739:184-705(+)
MLRSNDLTTQGEFTTNAMTFDTAHSKSPTNYETINEKLKKEKNDPLDYPLRKRVIFDKPSRGGFFRENLSVGELDPEVNNVESNSAKQSIIKERNSPLESKGKYSNSQEAKLSESHQNRAYFSSGSGDLYSPVKRPRSKTVAKPSHTYGNDSKILTDEEESDIDNCDEFEESF